MPAEVARGLKRRGTLTLRYVGVDEKSQHDYVTVVSDLEGSRVLFVADARKRESLEAFWALGLTGAQRAAIEAIAMEMWEPYVRATCAKSRPPRTRSSSTNSTAPGISMRAGPRKQSSKAA